ncbi:leucyl aminopeptidase [Rhodovulum sp. DZ06]|uniref:leucyl aminopeptidase n=1 Tax=Rhodovulum sp. DZ06 TaxID=3425126 RepID=UPI003D324B25
MSNPVALSFTAAEPEALASLKGRVVVLAEGPATLGAGAEAADAATGGALSRAIAAEDWKGKPGDALRLLAPAGLAADALILVGLGEAPEEESARKAGGAVAAALGGKPGAVFAPGLAPELAAGVAFGHALREYAFDIYKSGEDAPKAPAAVTYHVDAPEKVSRAAAPGAAVAEGVFFARDLVSEPANVLGTEDFAARLAAMGELGLEVEILDEDELERLGMRALLAVGQGSASPSKVVVMRWNGGGDEAPFAFVGKGVVFDTGGISLKPSAGMEEMTMDMGGAAVVSGVMRALALRKAKANVVGLVGLVENMPDGKATRPGDIVKAASGTTIEIINTDAEGRLVLADVLHYAQERFQPTGMVNLATLTGAMIVALGNTTAGYFSNSDKLSAEFQAAADAEGEAAWRLPMGPAYDKLIKSRLADIKNSAGRAAGSITAAQFLKRFVKDETPWIHIDIAGVTLSKEALPLSPKGATGWGVMALDRLIRDKFEG